MKRFISIMLTIAVICSCLITVSAAGKTMIFVSPDGKDSNSGIISEPLLTLQAARDAARKTGEGAVINIRGGVYRFDSSLELGEKDKNTTYRAYNGEKVIFTGANSIDPSLFAPVTDEEILTRIVDKSARSKVICADLTKAGITDFGEMKPYANASTEDKSCSPMLFVDDSAMTIARYPNDSYLYTGAVLTDTASTKDFEFRINDNRYMNWTKADDVWVFGYFNHDWAEGYIPVKIDYTKKSIVGKIGASFGLVSDRRFYFYNLLEELDKSGEWYLDRQTSKLYMIADLNGNSKIEFSTFNQSFIKMSNTSDISIEGINIQKGINYGIYMENCDKIKIDRCEMSGISDWAVSTKEVSNTIITNNYVHDVGSGGFILRGGNAENLTMANCRVENNRIERFGRIKTTYAGGITVFSLGNLVSHNEISDSPHLAIQYSGNDNIFEYNEIFDVCKDTSDCGAIYTGRSWRDCGNIIRYNYIHDLKMTSVNTSYHMQAVYLDDMDSNNSVYGNVFYNIDAVALYGGGRGNTFENNVMIECREPLTIDSRGTSWMDSGENSSIRQQLKSVDYKNGIWKEKHPELSNILEDEPEIPKYNIIRNNVEYKSAGYDIDPLAVKYGTIENNITVKDSGVFEDYRNKNFAIKEDSEVYKKIPDFQKVPFDKIGCYDVKLESVGKIVMLINSTKTLVGGNATVTDVPPQIVDSRTLVPVRFISENFGENVGWDENTKTVTIGDRISMTIGSNIITVDGKDTTTDVGAAIIEGRTMVPLRVIAEALGMEVLWNERGIIIISNEPTQPTDDEIDSYITTLK